METVNDDEIDEVFNPNFRKGRKGIEEEKRLKALADRKPVTDSQYAQGETNWDVEAVVDEDDL